MNRLTSYFVKAFFYNLFSSFILGVFPVLLLFYSMPELKFIEGLKALIPSNTVFVYLVGMAVIGVFFRIHLFYSLGKCGNCEKKDNVQYLSNKMIEPLIGVYQIVSGVFIAISFLVSIHYAFFALLFLLIGPFIDSILMKRNESPQDGVK